MNKLILLFISLFMIISITGCGGGSSSGGSTPPNNNSNILTVNVYDNTTKSPISGASLTILETSTIPSGNNPYNITLTSGRYSIYIQAAGYISRGYIIDINSNQTINAYLNQLNLTAPTCTVTGNLQQPNGSPYTGPFSIFFGGSLYGSNYKDLSNSDSSGYFTVNPSVSPSGGSNIAISAYTISGTSLSQIAYVKENLLIANNNYNVNLSLPANPVTYSGNKPASDLLVVKQNNGYSLAQQQSNSTTYSFGIGLASGDSITLESSYIDNNNNGYFIRKSVGSSGGSNNLTYQSGVPGFTLTGGTDCVVGITSVSYATYYEIYTVQNVANNPCTPFQMVVTSSNLSNIHIPKSIFNTSTNGTTFLLYIRAVNLPGYNLTTLLNGTQAYTNYSYIESNQTINNLSRLSIQAKDAIRAFSFSKKNNPILYKLHYLCTE